MRARRSRSITTPMLEALFNYLEEKPNLYLGEIAVLLCDEFGTQETATSIRRALISRNWSKAARQRAGELNQDLRDCYSRKRNLLPLFRLLFFSHALLPRR